jgi:Zn-dependent M28 family amino/carboxypeptidase
LLENGSHSRVEWTGIVRQAYDLGYGRYFLNSTRRIEDDHIPFREHGIPAVDIIDLDYGPLNLYWHTRLDTADKCSPGSLEIVGQVVQKSLQVLENQRFRINSDQ